MAAEIPVAGRSGAGEAGVVACADKGRFGRGGGHRGDAGENDKKASVGVGENGERVAGEASATQPLGAVGSGARIWQRGGGADGSVGGEVQRGEAGSSGADEASPGKVKEGGEKKEGDSTKPGRVRQAGGMAISGRLEVVLKFGEIPTGVETDKNGWKSFEVECAGKVVRLRVRPKNWMKLEQAQKEWPQWVAAAGGVLDVVEGAMVMPEANIQVFERKLKVAAAPAEPAAAPAEPSPEPKAG